MLRFTVIEFICRWEFLCELSKTFFFPCIHLVISFWVWEMSNLLWETLGHYPFHYFLHWWCDFAPCFYLSWSSLFSCLLCSHYNPFITFDLSHFFWPSCPSLAMIYFRFDIFFASFLHISLSVHFYSLTSYHNYFHIGHA